MRDLADVQNLIIALNLPLEMKSLRGKPRSIMFLGFNTLLSQQAAGNLTQERLKDELDKRLSGIPTNLGSCKQGLSMLIRIEIE
jgi:hypothetical protein